MLNVYFPEIWTIFAVGLRFFKSCAFLADFVVTLFFRLFGATIHLPKLLATNVACFLLHAIFLESYVD